MRSILLIVDPQNDFITGSLAVPGAEKAMQRLIVWMQDHKDSFDTIVVTMDQHPYDHCSFIDQGGQWPEHCVRYSEGAAIDPNLHNEIIHQTKMGKQLLYIEKATRANEEAYSAFSHSVPEIVSTAKRIYISGLAGDFCVAATYTDLSRHIPKERLELLHEGIAYITPSIH